MYTVVGWHTYPDHDPLQSIPQKALKKALEAYDLTPNESYLSDTSLSKLTDACVLCHGSLHKIKWYVLSQEIKYQNPADNIQASFFSNQPFAIGSNAIDALFAWLRANKDSDASSSALKKK